MPWHSCSLPSWPGPRPLLRKFRATLESGKSTLQIYFLAFLLIEEGPVSLLFRGEHVDVVSNQELSHLECFSCIWTKYQT